MTCEGCQQLLLVPLPSRAAGPGDGGLCTCPGTTVALQEGAESQRPTCRLWELSRRACLFALLASGTTQAACLHVTQGHPASS